jgi:hypothetical protein
MTTKGLFYRHYNGQPANNSIIAWREVAFADSNVASATKLATARTIWGQSFDGTTDITGDFTTANNAYISGNVGIGTTSPAYKLDVSDTGRFTGALYANSTLTASGQAALNGGAVIPADKTLKIGDCEITYDADNECLTFSKTIASNGDVVAYK